MSQKESVQVEKGLWGGVKKEGKRKETYRKKVHWSRKLKKGNGNEEN